VATAFLDRPGTGFARWDDEFILPFHADGFSGCLTTKAVMGQDCLTSEKGLGVYEVARDPEGPSSVTNGPEVNGFLASKVSKTADLDRLAGPRMVRPRLKFTEWPLEA